MAESEVSHSHPLDTMLAVSDVIRNDRLAKLYARVLELDSPTVEELSEGIVNSTTTIYEDVALLKSSASDIFCPGSGQYSLYI